MIDPEISVVMGVYNGEKYLKDSIKSILCQNFENFEFIIVNDGSVDATQSIIESFSDPRIIAIGNINNIGLTKSLNKGLRVARGRYIARMDADDVCHPNRLRAQYDFLEKNTQIKVLGTQAILIHDGKEVAGSISLRKPQHPGAIKWACIFDSPFIHSSVMIRNDYLRPCSEILYDESYRTSQDYELWTRLAPFYLMANLPVPLINFRVHALSVSSNYSKKNIEKLKEAIYRVVREHIKSDSESISWVNFWCLVNNKGFENNSHLSWKKSLLLLNEISRSYMLDNFEIQDLTEIYAHKSTVYLRIARYYLNNKYYFDFIIFIIYYIINRLKY